MTPDAEAAGLSAARLQRLTEMVQFDVDDGSIAGAVTLIARHGRLAYFHAAGFAERASLRPMQLDSLFRIASMTKPLTVLAALMLQERGKLLLSDPLARFIPEFAALQVGVEVRDAATGIRRLELEAARHPITLHDLMRHTAGFTYGDFGDSLVQRRYREARLLDPFQTNPEFVTKLARLPLACQPGGTFEYGLSTDVLGRVIEIAADMPLDRYFSEYILQPLRMHDTTFVLSADQKRRLAVAHREAAAVVPPAKPRELRTSRWASGGGGLLSTAADYARFCQMMLNGGTLDGVRLVGRKTVEQMTRNHLPQCLQLGPQTADLGLGAPLPAAGQGYGLGLGVRLEDGLAAAPGSRGDFSWSGITGPYFWVDPVEQLVVVFMLQEHNIERRARYRPLLRALVYQALQ